METLFGFEQTEIVDGVCPNCMSKPYTWYKGACAICWWRPGEEFFCPIHLDEEVWRKLRRGWLGKRKSMP